MTPSTNGAALGPGAEFDAIRSLLGRWGDLAVGVGDDAAVLAVPRGEQLVTSVDTAIEQRHFRREWLTPRQIGYRAVTAAMSDLAAMAALPLGVLVALTLPESWRGDLPEIADGIGDAVRAAGTVIRGGNITAGSELAITTTVFGSAFRPLRRTGAKAGDVVYVTGRLGGPGAALERLAGNRDPGASYERFVHPVARLAESRWLAREGATAAIDVSDGLVGDLRHLAAASGVSIDVEGANLPLYDGVTAEAAVASGEEYELVVTAPNVIDAGAFVSRFGIGLAAIGVVGGGPPGIVTVHGVRVANVASHDHLSR